MEIKQHATEYPMDHWRNKSKNKNIPRENENRNMTYQGPCDEAKMDLGRKVIVVQTYLKKQEKSQINNVT